jgi:hypothetical protein
LKPTRALPHGRSSEGGRPSEEASKKPGEREISLPPPLSSSFIRRHTAPAPWALVRRSSIRKTLIFFLLLGASACGEKEPAQAPEIPDVTIEQMEAYLRDAGSRIDALGERIERLGESAEASAAHAKAEVRAAISELREKRTAAQLKLEELRMATGGAWGDLRAGMEAALQELENACAAAAARFQ